jgi:glycogen synthase
MAGMIKRVMLWTHAHEPPVGGLDVFVEQLGQWLVRRGHEVLIVSGSWTPIEDGAEERVGGLHVRRFNFRDTLASRDPERIAAVLTRVNGLVASFQPDFNHLNFADSSAFFFARSRATKQPHLVQFHNSLQEMPSAWALARAIAARAPALVTPSRFLAEDVGAVLGPHSAKVRVIAHGVPETELLRVPLQTEDAAPVFSIISRLTAVKGPDIAIRALARLKGSARLRLVGAGEMKGRLRQMAHDLAMADRVEFCGTAAREGIPAILADSFAVLVPSVWREAFGLVAVEAALAARPVIASRIGGLPEVVRDEETGLVVEANNPEALAAAMNRLLTAPALARKLGAGGRAVAQRDYRLDTMGEALLRLYGTLAEKA